MSNPSLATLTQQQLVPLFDALAQEGLVLATVVNVQQLPATVWLDPTDTGRKASGSLLLLGHGGKVFWERYQGTEPVSTDPVDHFSAMISAKAIQKYLPNIHHEQLFPLAECPINLMALGRELGWHTPSPLGMGINAQYGLWSAYRALWWLDAELEGAAVVHYDLQNSDTTTDICKQCATQECLHACPASALSADTSPNLQKCADYRLAVASDCHDTCIARRACPVATEHRYSAEQMAYHYDLARSQIHLFSSRKAEETPKESNNG